MQCVQIVAGERMYWSCWVEIVEVFSEKTFSKMERLKVVGIRGFISVNCKVLCDLEPISVSASKIKLVEVLTKNLQALEKLTVHVNKKMKPVDEDAMHEFLNVFDWILCLSRGS